MSNDESMTKLENRGANAFLFVIRISTFLRHSSFVLCHSSGPLLPSERFSVS